MSYSAAVLADGPIGYYRLGESSGTTMADSSGNGRDGTYEGPPTLGVAGLLSGDADLAAYFDAGSEKGKVDVATHAAFKSAQVSVAARVKLAATGADQTIASRYNGTFSDSAWLFNKAGDGHFGVFIFSGGSYAYVVTDGSTTLDNGIETSVGFSFDGSTIRLFKNGVLVKSGPAAMTMNAAAANFTIGAEDRTNAPFYGTVDEVSVYDYRLPDARFATYHSEALSPTSDLPDPVTGTISASLPALSANLSGGIDFSGTITASLPALGASLSGTSLPPGVAGTLSAILPPLGGSLAGAYSDTATLAAILPPLSANLAGTYTPPPATGTLAASLPSLAASLSGTAYEPGMTGTLDAVLPVLSASLSGHVLGRNGFGLALDSAATLTVLEQVDTTTLPTPTGTPGVPATTLHIIAPTVPVPTLVDGRPQ